MACINRCGQCEMQVWTATIKAVYKRACIIMCVLLWMISLWMHAFLLCLPVCVYGVCTSEHAYVDAYILLYMCLFVRSFCCCRRRRCCRRCCRRLRCRRDLVVVMDIIVVVVCCLLWVLVRRSRGLLRVVDSEPAYVEWVGYRPYLLQT